MCCLFGMLDYGGTLNARQKNRMLSILAIECEARGTDAAGISYISMGKLHTYKRPGPAHKLRIYLPNGADYIMGHTRMTTQGSEKKNYNNHPFMGQIGAERFALAHNGILRNDRVLRRSLKLPITKIQTDSYVAVQLIEKQRALDFSSLKTMAEQVEGSFCFTILDEHNNWYLVKGDNPICVFHFPNERLYLYASTNAILEKALFKMGVKLGYGEQIEVDDGEILKINPMGKISRSSFEMQEDLWGYFGDFRLPYRHQLLYDYPNEDDNYMEELKAVASAFGCGSVYIDALREEGFSCEEIEEILYEGQSYARWESGRLCEF